MLDAHIDEIGFVVTEICDGGFLRAAAVGGIDTRVLSASEVTVYGKEAIRGVFTSKPPHLQEAGESRKKIELRDLYIDTGYDKEALSKLVTIGDAVGFYAPAQLLANGLVTSKAFDDRICAYAILRAVEAVDCSRLYNRHLRAAFRRRGNRLCRRTGRPRSLFVPTSPLRWT